MLSSVRGVRRMGAPEKVDADTQFGIGSTAGDAFWVGAVIFIT